MSPKFYKNLDDNLHCLQAALLTALNSAGFNFTWEDMDEFTEFDKKLYSWGSVAVANIHKLVPGIKFYSSNDHRKFAEEGEEHMKKEMDPKWFEVQKKHASAGFIRERRASKYIADHNLAIRDKVDLGVISRSLDDYFAIALIDVGEIDGGSSGGHFLVIFDQTEDTFIAHDPGLPPKENWNIRKDLFMKAFKKSLILIPKLSK